jgi:sugar lactone lactonase YvrE
MKKWTALVVVLLIVVWWIAAAPRREIRSVRSAVFDPSLSAAINAVDHSADSGTTRLIAEGFHFINGIPYDLHPGQPREESVIVTQTSEFRLTRFYLRGPKAGKFEIVLNGLTGMADGMNRDAAGRIWFAVFAERTPLLTWLHAHAWIKPLFMRLPTKLLLSQAKHTGAIVVSPDGRTPLYSAMYQGPAMSALASTVPSPGGIYLANEPLGSSGQEKSGVLRLKWPSELQ